MAHQVMQLALQAMPKIPVPTYYISQTLHPQRFTDVSETPILAPSFGGFFLPG